jgi:hypothetical protein
MNKWIIVGSVWTAAMTSAVALTYKINHPLDHLNLANAMSVPGDLRGQAMDEPVADTEEQTVLQMPMVTIVGGFHGVAEMQGTGQVIIGPGIVTHGE